MLRKGKLIIFLWMILLLLTSAAFAEPVESNRINGDVVQLSGNIIINQGDVVSGNVVTLRGDISVAGRVNGDVVTMLGNINLQETAEIMGDVVVAKGQIYKKDGAIVRGNLVSGGEMVDLRINDYIPPVGVGSSPNSVNITNNSNSFFGSLLKLLGVIGLAVICVSVFPNHLSSMSNEINRDLL
ncbi:MAG: polymer-forming cytoskeletal protein, partial [Bacillota bacterium]|nr:polymer-forming cytoskeletal protein [Bacillota bacterium]